ncbi:MAG: hypothetical protein EPO02_03540 [Nitrospirae bacterium]|nr:MAG: hypothetical protein EPO02_03540 [Nitrospirota bacterium]
MHAAVLLGAVIVLGLIVADWRAFSRTAPAVVTYGVAVERRQEPLAVRRGLFDADGLLKLPRGRARLFPEQRAILLEPDLKQFGVALRTAWPLNGFVHYAEGEESAPATLTKRMPWSSVLLTALWFLTVAGGTLVYVVSYAMAGGLSSAGGAFLAVALSGLGLLVCLFGLLIVVVAYRLENKRLMALYEEFKAAL